MSEMTNISRGDCLDCKKPVVSGTLDGEYTVIHSQVMCDGFRKRFTPSVKNPVTTKAVDEQGNEVEGSGGSAKAAKKLPDKTTGKGDK